jgi:GAF domain-containing protein
MLSAYVLARPRWARSPTSPTRSTISTVWTQLSVRGVLAVPVVVAGRSVGALSVSATQPCPWSGIDVAAVGAYAGVAELVAASMALGARDAEVAERPRR